MEFLNSIFLMKHQVLKWLSPIHFVKILLSNFLGNEFLEKMNKPLQNYTLKIDNISKIYI